MGDFHTASRRVLVVGNSFSAAFVAAFDDLVATDRYAVTVTSCWGASPAPGIENDGRWDRANAYYWSEVVPALVRRLRAGDWVFAVNDLAEFAPPSTLTPADEKLKSLEEGLRSLSQLLTARGVRLAVLHGIPFARDAECDPDLAAPQWFAPFGPPCHFLSRSATLSRRAGLSAVLSSLEARGLITTIDLMDVFCPSDVCSYEAKDGQMLYRDDTSHPSIEAARLSGENIRRVLGPGINQPRSQRSPPRSPDAVPASGH